MANPIAESVQVADPQIDAGYVSFLAAIQRIPHLQRLTLITAATAASSISSLFTKNNCNSNDSDAAPFFWNKKIAIQPNGNSTCIRVNTPSYRAGSFVYINDGAPNGECSLQTYGTTNCRDEFKASYDVDQDVSGCISTNSRALKVVCPA
jgi:hypothetical protein